MKCLKCLADVNLYDNGTWGCTNVKCSLHGPLPSTADAIELAFIKERLEAAGFSTANVAPSEILKIARDFGCVFPRLAGPVAVCMNPRCYAQEHPQGISNVAPPTCVPTYAPPPSPAEPEKPPCQKPDNPGATTLLLVKHLGYASNDGGLDGIARYVQKLVRDARIEELKRTLETRSMASPFDDYLYSRIAELERGASGP